MADGGSGTGGHRERNRRTESWRPVAERLGDLSFRSIRADRLEDEAYRVVFQRFNSELLDHPGELRCTTAQVDAGRHVRAPRSPRGSGAPERALCRVVPSQHAIPHARPPPSPRAFDQLGSRSPMEMATELRVAPCVLPMTLQLLPRPPVATTTTTQVARPPRLHDHPGCTTTQVARPPRLHDHPGCTTTQVARPPRLPPRLHDHPGCPSPKPQAPSPLPSSQNSDFRSHDLRFQISKK